MKRTSRAINCLLLAVVLLYTSKCKAPIAKDSDPLTFKCGCVTGCLPLFWFGKTASLLPIS